jgi:hypothetical protein
MIVASTDTVRMAVDNTDSAARLLSPTLSGNVYSQAVLTWVSTGTVLGPLVRCHPASSTDESCYIGTAENSASRHAIYEVSATFGFTAIGTDAVAPTSGQTFRIEANGSSLTMTANGTNRAGGPITDTTLGAATYTQVGLYSWTTTASNCDIDNFDGGDLTSPNSFTPAVAVTSLAGIAPTRSIGLIITPFTP